MNYIIRYLSGISFRFRTMESIFKEFHCTLHLKTRTRMLNVLWMKMKKVFMIPFPFPQLFFSTHHNALTVLLIQMEI